MKTNMKIDVEKSIIYRFDDTNDLSDAVLLLGEKGYFSDDKDFSDYITGTLTRVLCCIERTAYTFVCGNGKYSDAYRYFIPKYKEVFKEEPKKKTWRQFESIDELFTVTSFRIGKVVHIKRFVDCTYEEKTILNGFRVYADNEFHRIDVIFGSGSRTLAELFKCYKYYKNGEWLPFGIEE